MTNTMATIDRSLTDDKNLTALGAVSTGLLELSYEVRGLALAGSTQRRLPYTRVMHSTSTSQTSVTSTLALIALLVIAVLVARSRRASKDVTISAGQRIRHIAITVLDPLVSLIVIAPALWRLLASDEWHIPAAVLSGCVGIIIGLQRAKVMMVSARRDIKSVVLRRSGLEYGLVGLLIALRSLEANLNLHDASLASTGVCALAGLGLAEAFARSGRIIQRYLAEESPQVNP